MSHCPIIGGPLKTVEENCPGQDLLFGVLPVLLRPKALDSRKTARDTGSMKTRRPNKTELRRLQADAEYAEYQARFERACARGEAELRAIAARRQRGGFLSPEELAMFDTQARACQSR